MSNTRFTTGAVVLGSNGEQFGTVARITDSAIHVDRDGRMIEIPLEHIDLQRTGQSEVYLQRNYQPALETVELRTEEIQVETREVERGRIRIDKSVEHVPFHQDIELAVDEVDVQHVPVGQEFDEMPQPRYEGDTFIIPVVEEVVVLTRRYRVIEEVHVSRHRELRTEHIEEDLRRESVDVNFIRHQDNEGDGEASPE